MSEGENGANANSLGISGVNGEQPHQQQQESVVGLGRILGGRSASPAKRSATDMENSSQNTTKVPGSFTNEGSDRPTDFDAFMDGLTAAAASSENGLQASQSQMSGVESMSDDCRTLDTAVVGAGSVADQVNVKASNHEPYSTDDIDKQVEHVYRLASKLLDEGDRGVIISNKWLSRVVARSSEHLKSSEYPKDAREGLVGPLDNSDIVPEGALDPPHLRDSANSDFIPLKPGLVFEDQYQVLPYEAYGYIIDMYGSTGLTTPIVRYAHNTAPAGALQTNIQYEIYPPIVTVRKVPQPSSDSSQSSKPSAPISVNNSRLKHERQGRGQRSADDAPKLVSSSTESFSKFLARAKDAAGIPRTRKVKIWRLNSLEAASVDTSGHRQSVAPSPPASRDASPVKSTSTNLVVDKETFEKLEIGKDVENTELPDNTSDPNYKGIGTLSMDDAGLKTGTLTIILEEQIGGPAGGEFQSDSKKIMNRVIPRKGKTDSTHSSGRTSPAPGIMTRGRTRKDGRTRGTVGLMNLGNTCYMNSALQCIRSVEELAVFFLSQRYKKEINNDNPLGHHGAMANAYAGVLRGIYESSTGGAFSPSNFKKTLGSLQPMFSGYGQQDSQEFLSFLVDALHEDLNRIVKKPYIENPDSDDSKVHDPHYILELGEIYRDNHRKRNDSVAMDLFSGFYKNTMECPVCDKVSVTFDPYSLLTVQLPMDHAFQHTITFIPLEGPPILHDIDMDKNSTIKVLKEHIAKKHPGVDANRLWVIEMYSHKVYKTFDDASTLAEANITSNDYIFMYELDSVPKNAPSTKKSYSFYNTSSKKEDEVPADGMNSDKADVFAVPIFNRMRKSPTSNSMDAILHPLYITLTREEAQDSDIILKKVLLAVSNITTRPFLTEFNDDDQAPNGAVEEMEAEDETSKEPANGDDSAGVSDHSAQSEDGYVNVSLEKHDDASRRAIDSSPMQVDEVDHRIPANFMDPEYFISPALRTHLFDLKYAESYDNNMHCASLTGFRDVSVRPLFDRVKKPSRRSSVQSSASGGSSPSTGSGLPGQDDSEESDIDQPDIRLGDAQFSTESVDESDDELTNGPKSTIMEPSPIDYGKNGRKRDRKRRGKKGPKARRGGAANGNATDRNPNRFGLHLFSNKSKQAEDGPYFVQLGECIVLDWRPEGFDGLFGGERNGVEEMRGARITDDRGRGGPRFEDEEVKARKLRRAERKQNGIDLEDCFTETGKREVLSEDNAWYCNRCKELRQAHKTLEIWTLPDILVVHMKRFGGTRSFRDKIDVFVDYPIEGLDMTDKVGVKEDGKEYIYDLFAVDNHFGGLGGGHYTSYAKNFYDGEWYDYNDSITGRVGAGRNLKSSAAYLLFYRRRSDKPLGPPALQELVLDFRKPVPDAAGEEEAVAADDESGEGKLGGPTLSSPHRNGSSSVLAGPGVAMMNSPRGPGLGNGGAGADSRLTPRRTMTNEYDDEDDEDDDHTGGGRGVAGLIGWHDTQPGWNFSTLETAQDHLLDRMEDDDSTKAEIDDHDSGIGGSSLHGMDTSGMSSPSGLHNSPILPGYDDDDEDSHGYGNEMQMGESEAVRSIEESVPHDIVLDDISASDETEGQDKMD